MHGQLRGHSPICLNCFSENVRYNPNNKWLYCNKCEQSGNFKKGTVIIRYKGNMFDLGEWTAEKIFETIRKIKEMRKEDEIQS